MNANQARWCGVFSIFLIVGISYIDRINISVLITQADFLQHIGLQAGDKGRQGMLATAFMLGYGVSSIVLTPFCIVAFGVRRSFIYGLSIWGVVTMLTPLLHSYGLLLGSRALLGVAEGPLFALAGAYIKAYFAGHENGKPNSFVNMGTSLGLAVGYPFIGFLILAFEWEASFHILGLLNLLVGIPLVLLFVRMPQTAAAQTAPRLKLGDVLGRRVPQMFKSAMQTRHIIVVTILTSSFMAYLWGASNWLPAYLKEARGFSLAEMGPLASLPQWATLAAVLLGGVLIDRLERRRVPLIFVIGSLGVMLSVLLAINVDNRYLAVYSMAAAGFFWGLQSPAIPSTVQYYAKPEDIASAFGVVNGVACLVAAMMPMLMGAAISYYTGGSASALAAYSIGFGLLVGAQLITLLCGACLWWRVGQGARKDGAVDLTAQTQS